jgi:hypothetical protein
VKAPSVCEVFVRHASPWLIPLVIVALSACGDDPPPSAPTPPTPAPATVVGVGIEGPAQRDLGAPGQTVQLRAIATLSDGSRPDVTNDAAWSVGNSRVLSVSPRGLVTGLADGSDTVTATYRERAGATTLRVAEELGPRFPVTGVVRDAVRGTPIVGAYIMPSSVNDQPLHPAITPLPAVRTDGNGFFEIGALAGRHRVFIDHFGYEAREIALSTLTAPASLDIRLQPDTGPFIERTLAGEFDGVDDLGLDTWTVRISTRGSGVFDAVARARSCEPGGALLIVAQNGGFADVSTLASCDYARVRLILRGSDVRLTIKGHQARGWELTYREPR